ncbi:receptor-like kinase TMK4 [Malania oleifera]|uniref:receptor-like kinase TMK4 n=1 Tax=Malania oleifera TaxID=397392 RepID=UPI0025AE0252|nr:receptor-like kinase TMK4 [Malania oleifera]
MATARSFVTNHCSVLPLLRLPGNGGGRLSSKMDVFAFGVILMELSTGKKQVHEDISNEKIHLVYQFNNENIDRCERTRNLLDCSLNPMEEIFDSLCKVADLVCHCTHTYSDRRPSMSAVVSALAPLVELLDLRQKFDEGSKCSEVEYLNLHQAVEDRKAGRGTATMQSKVYNSHSN